MPTAHHTKGGDSVQQRLSVCPDRLQLVCHIIWVAQRRPMNFDASFTGLRSTHGALSTTRRTYVSRCSHASGLAPARFQSFVVFPAWTWMRAFSQRAFSNRESATPTRSWRHTT